MNKVAEEYLKKSKNNFDLYERLKSENVFIDWQMTAIFYSALCHMKAYFFNKNQALAETATSHTSLQSLISSETELKRLGILRYYYPLYCLSRDARYKLNKIKPFHVQDGLKKYSEIIKLVKI